MIEKREKRIVDLLGHYDYKPFLEIHKQNLACRKISDEIRMKKMLNERYAKVEVSDDVNDEDLVKEGDVSNNELELMDEGLTSQLIDASLLRLLVKLKLFAGKLKDSKTESERTLILGTMISISAGISALGVSNKPRSILAKITALIAAVS